MAFGMFTNVATIYLMASEFLNMQSVYCLLYNLKDRLPQGHLL